MSFKIRQFQKDKTKMEEKVNNSFYVLVIGAATNNPQTVQLPNASNLKSFIDRYPSRSFTFYFIDPAHRENKTDQEFFQKYREFGVDIEVSYGSFSLDRFMHESPLQKVDCIFIDYAGVTNSEYDFSAHFG